MEGCFIFTTNQPTNGKSELFHFCYLEKEKLLPKHSTPPFRPTMSCFLYLKSRAEWTILSRFHRQPLLQDFSRHGLSTAFPVRISAMNTYTGRFRFINKYYVVLLLVGLGRCRTLLPYLFTFEFSLNGQL